ncbi:MAG: class D beta-lactamase [Spirochaetia bacterium]|nr:class D beta-lactamase [Spirochaetia bacterium]
MTGNAKDRGRRVRLQAVFIAVAFLVVPRSAVTAQEKGGLKCTVIADAITGTILHKSGECDKRVSPCSTFKFALAIMGFDSEILKSPKSPTWELKPEYNPSQRDQGYKHVSPDLWERESVVWFSQQLTTRLGEKRLSDYVKKFEYGNQDVSGDPGKHNGLTHAWLMSSLAISPNEQIRFLLKFLNRKLPVTERTYASVRSIIPEYKALGGWVVYGKSGSGWLRDSNGEINENAPLGWFVGWAEKKDRQVVFARLEIRNAKSSIAGGPKAREDMLNDLDSLIGRQ